MVEMGYLRISSNTKIGISLIFGRVLMRISLRLLDLCAWLLALLQLVFLKLPALLARFSFFLEFCTVLDFAYVDLMEDY